MHSRLPSAPAPALGEQIEAVQQSHANTLYAVAMKLRAALLSDPVLAKHTEWVRVQARTKAAYSAYTKMQRKGVGLDSLDDLLGLRVIFRPTVTKKLPLGLHRQRQCMLCYRVLEVAHAHYPQAIGRRAKDYVTMPKPNGYQSLHSTVFLDEKVRAELQVRRFPRPPQPRRPRRACGPAGQPHSTRCLAHG